MARIDDSVLTGEIETLTPESASRILASTEERDLSLEGDEERTTFLARPAGLAAQLARPPAREDRTRLDAPVAKRAPMFDAEEKTIVGPMSAPVARDGVGPTRPSAPPRALPPPPWQRRPLVKPELPGRSRVEQIREATHVAFVLPKRAPSFPSSPAHDLRPTWTSEDRTNVCLPAPPHVRIDRTDTLSPMASPLAADSMATLADTSRTAQTVLTSRPPRSASFFMAASIGMVGAIFVTGIALGSVATRKVTASAAASRVVNAVAPTAPVEPAPAAIAVLAPSVPVTPTPTPTVTPSPAVADDSPKHANPIRGWSAPSPRPAPVHVVAAAPAPKPAAKARPAPKAPSDDVDEANAADALAKAQLDAALR